MKPIDTSIARLAARQHSAVSNAQLQALGLSDSQRKSRIECGLLVPVFEGVYRHAAGPPTWKTRLMAAVLSAGPGAVASHRSAGRLHGLRDVPRFRPELTVPTADRPEQTGMTPHRTNRLEPIDVTVVDGIPCTSIPRTLLDLGAVTPYEIVAESTGDAIIRGLVTDVELVSLLERLGSRGRRGVATLRAVLLGAIPPEGIQSRLEQKGFELVSSLPVKPPVLQYELHCADGRRVVLDKAWPAEQVALDWEGRLWHATKKDFEQTMARSRSIVASGWQHYRYGWSDVTHRWPQTRVELLSVLPPRADLRRIGAA